MLRLSSCAALPASALQQKRLRLCSELADWKVAKILASEASYEDFKTAMTCAEGQDAIIGPAKHPLAGRAALLYEIIMADEGIWGETIELK